MVYKVNFDTLRVHLSSEVYLPLKRLINQSKNPGCFCAGILVFTGFTFLIGLLVGDGVDVGEIAIVSAGRGGEVGIRVGMRVGNRSGIGVLVG